MQADEGMWINSSEIMGASEIEGVGAHEWLKYQHLGVCMPLCASVWREGKVGAHD